MCKLDRGSRSGTIGLMETHDAVPAWTRLLRARDTALRHVDAALKAEALPPLAWYDVLLELDRAGAPLRARELETRLLLEQYNLSRLLDRMEAAGLIERRPAPEDRRGRLIGLQAAGADLRRRMWPVYRRAIGTAVGDRLSAAEAKQLADLLGRLL